MESLMFVGTVLLTILLAVTFIIALIIVFNKILK